MFTVGPVAENTYIFRRDGSDRALIVDPGDEAEKLLAAIDFASSTSSLARSTLKASRGGRAVARMAPALGWARGGP